MFKYISITVFIFLYCAVFSKQDDTYRASVVELEKKILFSTQMNTKRFIKLIEEASENDSDIIIFPESVLTQNFGNLESRTVIVPSKEEGATPCGNYVYSELLQKLSCAARDNNIYVVVNLSEKEYCHEEDFNKYNKSCNSQKFIFYNTNVAFDRSGTIVARYRKFNLYGETGFNATIHPEIETFTTDFNVTFGLFTCFDIVFSTPALTLTQKLNVTDIIFPTMWFSESPFLTATQVHQMWAYVNKVNFLAAGANFPEIGSTGSGIYEGCMGTKELHITGESGSKLLTQNVTKAYLHNCSQVYNNEINKNPTESLFLKTDNMTPYTHKNLNIDMTAETSNQSVDICDRGLCCSFEVKIGINNTNLSNETYHYKYVVFNGVRSYGDSNTTYDSDVTATGGVQICGIVACKNNNITTCGKRYSATTVSWPITFKYIKIKGTFVQSEDTIQFPNTLNADIVPLSISKWHFDVDEDADQVSFQLKEEETRLLTFAIYGRNFARDGEPVTRNRSENIRGGVVGLIICILYLLFHC